MTLEEITDRLIRARLDITSWSEERHLANEGIAKATTEWIEAMHDVDRHIPCPECRSGVGMDCGWDDKIMDEFVHPRRQRLAREAAGVA